LHQPKAGASPKWTIFLQIFAGLLIDKEALPTTASHMGRPPNWAKGRPAFWIYMLTRSHPLETYFSHAVGQQGAK
jgi:hypothetical protein